MEPPGSPWSAVEIAGELASPAPFRADPSSACEANLPKVEVASSNLVSRSNYEYEID
jgi:hypothetical protein